MKRRIELPLVEPLFSAYQNQGSGCAVIYANPSIRNWYLTHSIILECSREFLSGRMTPDIDIKDSNIYENPHLDRQSHPTQFAKGYINPIIRELLNQGYYVYFWCVDDYYVEGKSGYKEHHMKHDGLICGYDQAEKTYCIYSYDKNWIYKKFYTSQKSFNDGRRAILKTGQPGVVCGIKPKPEQVEFEPDIVRQKLIDYLDSSLEKYPTTGEGYVYGIAVHDYIAMYVDKLFDGSIPYERMDRRVFRLIWEHKKAMLERLQKTEEVLKLDSESSTAYKKLVAEADAMRMLYASHHMKRRDSVLPHIHKKLISLRQEEYDILTEFVKKMGDARDK